MVDCASIEQDTYPDDRHPPGLCDCELPANCPYCLRRLLRLYLGELKILRIRLRQTFTMKGAWKRAKRKRRFEYLMERCLPFVEQRLLATTGELPTDLAEDILDLRQSFDVLPLSSF